MSTPNRAVTQRSTFAPEKTITLDPWSVNPGLPPVWLTLGVGGS